MDFSIGTTGVSATEKLPDAGTQCGEHELCRIATGYEVQRSVGISRSTDSEDHELKPSPQDQNAHRQRRYHSVFHHRPDRRHSHEIWHLSRMVKPHLHLHHHPESPKQLPWTIRVRHVTWAYFTLTMATGGLANVLSAGEVPFRFKGLYTIGLIIFFLNIFLYVVIWAMIISRFVLNPSTFRDSLTHPTESLFVPAFAVSLGTILITIDEYGADRAGEWLLTTVLVLFWLDAALAVLLSITVYMILWSTTSFTIAQMTPIWIFPAYPLLIIGPHAANLSRKLHSSTLIIEVIVGGFTIQGIGFLVALTIYSAFVYRLMTHKLPADPLRPGMFVSVGPSAFTVSGTIGMAESLHNTISSRAQFMDVPGLLAAQILKLVANWMSLWLWGLSIWFFFVALVSNMQCFRASHRMPFAMTWFSFIFPQTALCTATFAVAKAFDIFALQVIGCAMTILLVIVYIFVVVMMVRAIVKHDILWPERGEDKDEGGFRKRRHPQAKSVEERPDAQQQAGSTSRSRAAVELKDLEMANGDFRAEQSLDSSPTGLSG